MVVAIFINYEIKMTMHSHLKQRIKLYPKRHAKHYIVYKIYFIKTQKKKFRLNLNNKSLASTYIHENVHKIPLDSNQCVNLMYIIDKLLETK